MFGKIVRSTLSNTFWIEFDGGLVAAHPEQYPGHPLSPVVGGLSLPDCQGSHHLLLRGIGGPLWAELGADCRVAVQWNEPNNLLQIRLWHYSCVGWCMQMKVIRPLVDGVYRDGMGQTSRELSIKCSITHRETTNRA